MPYSYTVSTVIPASPAEIYDAWLDSIAHSEMTGGEAIMSDEVGAEVSAWDGYITGRILELVPGGRIVQSWRTVEFDEQIEDSIVTILLQETKDGTLSLEHSNVPDEHKSYEEGGWQSNYFEPMVAYFGDKEEDLAEPEKRRRRAGRQLPWNRFPARARAKRAQADGVRPSRARQRPSAHQQRRRRTLALQKLLGKPQKPRQRRLQKNPPRKPLQNAAPRKLLCAQAHRVPARPYAAGGCKAVRMTS